METGCTIAILFDRINTGNDEYTPASLAEGAVWPLSPAVWFWNEFTQLATQNIIFAIFTEGLLLICAKLTNPFDTHEYCFPEYAYDAYIYNNCRALWSGARISRMPGVLDDLVDTQVYEEGLAVPSPAEIRRASSVRRGHDGQPRIHIGNSNGHANVNGNFGEPADDWGGRGELERLLPSHHYEEH